MAHLGEPPEVAREFRDAQSRPRVRPPSPAVPPKRSALGRFFGVVVDARAWAALFYMFFSVGSGIASYTWAVTGSSLSPGLLVLIVGLPILGHLRRLPPEAAPGRDLLHPVHDPVRPGALRLRGLHPPPRPRPRSGPRPHGQGLPGSRLRRAQTTSYDYPLVLPGRGE